MQKAYFQRVPGKAKYELWTRFALDKITEGSIRLIKTQESKKDLQLKQMELEVGRLNTLLELKKEHSTANSNRATDNANS